MEEKDKMEAHAWDWAVFAEALGPTLEADPAVIRQLKVLEVEGRAHGREQEALDVLEQAFEAQGSKLMRRLRRAGTMKYLRWKTYLLDW